MKMPSIINKLNILRLCGRNISVEKNVCSQFFYLRVSLQTEKSLWQKPTSYLKAFQKKYVEEEEIICRKSYAYILLGYLSGRNCYSLLQKPISFQRPSTLKSQNKSFAESNQLTDLHLQQILVSPFQILLFHLAETNIMSPQQKLQTLANFL